MPASLQELRPNLLELAAAKHGHQLVRDVIRFNHEIHMIEDDDDFHVFVG